MPRISMLTLALGVTAVVIALAAFEKPAVSGKTKATRITREIGAFEQLDLRGPVDAVVTIGAASGITIEGDGRLVGLVATELQDGRLVVSLDEAAQSKTPPVVRVTTAKLSALLIRGSGDARIKSLAGGSLKLSTQGSGDIVADGRVDAMVLETLGSGDMNLKALSSTGAEVSMAGSGDIHLGKIEGSRLSIITRGSGDVRAIGSAGLVDVTVEGSGDVDLSKLKATDATVTIRGSGDVALACERTLKIEQLGTGDVRHTGAAQVTRSKLP